MKKRRIWVFTEHYPPRKGGISRYIHQLCQAWAVQGVEIRIGTTIPGASHWAGHPRIQLLEFPKRKQTYLDALRVFWRFYWLWMREDNGIFFFPVWNPYAIFALFFKMIGIRKLRYIVAAHGAEVLALQPDSSFPVLPIFKKLGRKALQYADAVFAVSSFTANLLSKIGVIHRKINTFPNGVDPAFFRPIPIEKLPFLTKYGIRHPHWPLALTVAQLNERKGMDIGIETIYRLKEEGININYVIIGQGPDFSRLQSLIQKYSLSDRIYIFTQIQDQDLVRFYNVCDVFLLLSRWEGDTNVEGFGIVLLEANSCEKPVIAGRSGGIVDAVVDGKTGFLVNPTDVADIKEKICFLLEKPDLAREMGKYGRQLVVERFNWMAIGQQMMDTMRKMFN